MLRPVTDGNLADRVYERLHEAISEGRYAPGTRLIERRLAAELEVSHIPVREALARLADEGLVERLPRRGSRVATLTLNDLEEISGIRVLLEQFVAVRVQQNATPAAKTELYRLVASMREAGARGDVRRVVDLDRRLHERLSAVADHALLLDLVSQLRGRIGSFLRAATATLPPDALEEHADAHAVLLDAIFSGDPEAAKAAMAEHVETATRRVRESLISESAVPAR